VTRVIRSVEPPRWAQAIVCFVLPCDPMRDAILGDLHEELVRDAHEAGVRRARTRYVRSVAEIVTHALSDTLRWRSWVSTSAPVDGRGPMPMTKERARAPGVGVHAGLALIAVGVLIAGIIVNNVVFTAVTRTPTPAAHHPVTASTVLGFAAVVLLLACAGVAAAVLCAGPRWLYMRKG
jgi:hypothetical protein